MGRKVADYNWGIRFASKASEENSREALREAIRDPSRNICWAHHSSFTIYSINRPMRNEGQHEF